MFVPLFRQVFFAVLIKCELMLSSTSLRPCLISNKTHTSHGVRSEHSVFGALSLEISGWRFRSFRRRSSLILPSRRNGRTGGKAFWDTRSPRSWLMSWPTSKWVRCYTPWAQKQNKCTGHLTWRRMNDFDYVLCLFEEHFVPKRNVIFLREHVSTHGPRGQTRPLNNT